MMSLLSSFLLVMAVWGSHHTNLANAEGIVISNSKAALTEYWQTMLPDSRMPLAILELLPTSAGYVDHMGKQDNDHIHTPDKWTRVKYVGPSLPKARKIRLHSTSEAKEKTEIDSKRLPLWIWAWAPNTNGDDEKIQHKLPLWIWAWGPHTNRDDEKVQHKLPLWIWAWAPHTNGEDEKVHIGRVPTTMLKDQQNILMFWGWGPEKKKGDKTTRHMVAEVATETNDLREDDGHQGIMSNSHDESTVSKFIFHEDAFTPGSTIIPYIQPSATSHGPLLRRDIADAIPMSTRNFSDILEMFAPASHAMADDIWMMLDLCENPHPIKGEKKTCATSLESMVEFAASVLTGGNTRDLRVFSSPDVPAKGVTSGRKYNVVAARKATESSKTMTCHGMSFPFTVFMCHAVNPTRTYELTLESEDFTSRVVVLAVCHLDTSEFNPAKMPGHAKPGDEPACHFIGRDNVLWAPASPAAPAA